MSARYPGMRLSPARVVIAAVAAVGLAAGGVVGYQAWASAQADPSGEPWFAGYVDVTATPRFAFETPASEAARHAVLSFIVADPDDACEPSWGGYYTLDSAAAELDLDRRIALLRERGGDVAVSFGGLLGDELGSACTDEKSLADAYTAVIDRYSISTIDLDLEGDELADTAGAERRASVIAELQAERPADKPLAVWVTLPASTSGLTQEGTDAVATLLDHGVDLAGINAMTMNFGESRDDDVSMGAAPVSALEATHRQVSTLYQRAGIPLSDATVWTKVGATPMIGQNDVRGEIFDLADAAELNDFALEKGLGRMSMWSLNRDRTCGVNYVTTGVASDSCSGIDQGEDFFADALATGFAGTLLDSASQTTSPEPVDPASLVDDPATSPYPVWDEESAYLQGSKVVWHRNVYEAKWWTSGDLPDNPVLNEWETPWTLLGPVLPGEKPIDTTVDGAGMFPEWIGTEPYEKGDVVTFDGVPYRAKWWTQGDSPEALSSDPDGSPWVALTQKQVDALAAP
ncbi:chitinase [Microbacteriaceae bacterium SG_E_30_P1]|uniref:Chitinase n=1 Tax=Antiquaquibacter oligotrophicus TaxID=2880260 RepID=A0ABT6KJV3_9MICO|nr:carbohydrate-binding protein [Antiquaquibacter oligotrophicus]MDH6180246.1 chitinase [Antiquaquibacter oligotrophicus]UDF14007.1 glycosyl hydrolase family 18 [Antiquaquibacter oligotrophicus]